MNCEDPKFWDERYEAGRMPWDLGGVPMELEAFLRRQPTPGRALIPGCGSAYEVRAFAGAGWEVVAIDYSEAAVQRARAVLGELGRCVRCADFFKGEAGGPFDVVYERTFLCSLPKSRWSEYARRMAELIKPGGCLIGVFFCGHDPEPPPFGISEDEARQLFRSAFQLVEDAPIPAERSLPVYNGKERWQVWQRKPGAGES